jgi:hypothetical protein
MTSSGHPYLFIVLYAESKLQTPMTTFPPLDESLFSVTPAPRLERWVNCELLQTKLAGIPSGWFEDRPTSNNDFQRLQKVASGELPPEALGDTSELELADCINLPRKYFRLKKLEELRPIGDMVPPRVRMDAYLKCWTQQYIELMRKLEERAGVMHPKCRLSICIPAIATQEFDYVGTAIQAFSKQSTPGDEFEIVILLNCREKDAKNNAEKIALTVKSITEAKTHCPHLRVVTVPLIFADDAPLSIGLLRSIVSDLALIRHVHRNHASDHILVRCDADTRGVDAEYVGNFLRRFEKSPLPPDTLTGTTYWSLERAINDPLFFIALCIDKAIDLDLKYVKKVDLHGGPNVAVRASRYALVGGYDDAITIKEDGDFAGKLAQTRHEDEVKNAFRFARLTSRVYTSSRRAEAAFRAGYTPAEQWANDTTSFSTTETDPRLCGMETPHKLDPVKPSIAAVEDTIKNLIRSYTNHYRLVFSVKDPPLAKYLGLVLGIEYVVDKDGQLKVISIDKFWRRFSQFRQSGQALPQRRLDRVLQEFL